MKNQKTVKPNYKQRNLVEEIEWFGIFYPIKKVDLFLFKKLYLAKFKHSFSKIVIEHSLSIYENIPKI